jgi:pimeloyl-ACP methyl ester carboxylesterase
VHEGLPPERISALAEYLAAPVEGGFVWKQDPEVKTGGIPIPFSPAFSRALWKRITCPVLFIYGERSHLLPGKRTNSSGSLDEILSHFQNLETHSLDSGHNPHHEKPEEVMQLLEAFFQKHPG